MTSGDADPASSRRLAHALGDPTGVVVAAFVEPSCDACTAVVRAVARFANYPGVTTRTIEVPPGSLPPGGRELGDLPALVVMEGGAERLRRHGHHEEDALASSIRHALDDLPPAYEHRSP